MPTASQAGIPKGGDPSRVLKEEDFVTPARGEKSRGGYQEMPSVAEEPGLYVKIGKPPQLKNIKMMIKTFKGKSEENIEEWLEEFALMVDEDTAFNSSRWDDVAKKMMMIALFEDDAKRWYLDLGLAGKKADFEELSVLAVSKFRSKKSKAQWTREALSRQKKTTETFSQYGAELKLLKRMGKLDEDVIVDTFCNNVGPTTSGMDISTVLKNNEFMDLDAAIAKAELLAGNDGLGMGMKTKRAPVNTATPGKPNPPKEASTNAVPHDGYVKRPVTCFSCGEQGHFARSCRNRSRTGRHSKPGQETRFYPVPPDQPDHSRPAVPTAAARPDFEETM